MDYSPDDSQPQATGNPEPQMPQEPLVVQAPVRRPRRTGPLAIENEKLREEISQLREKLSPPLDPPKGDQAGEQAEEQAAGLDQEFVTEFEEAISQIRLQVKKLERYATSALAAPVANSTAAAQTAERHLNRLQQRLDQSRK